MCEAVAAVEHPAVCVCAAPHTCREAVAAAVRTSVAQHPSSQLSTAGVYIA